MLIFTEPPFSLKVYGLYTHENVDIYRRPLSRHATTLNHNASFYSICTVGCGGRFFL